MSARDDNLKARFRGIKRGYPGEPASMSTPDLDSLNRRVDTLQEQMRIILGAKGDVLDQHVAVRDLLDLLDEFGSGTGGGGLQSTVEYTVGVGEDCISSADPAGAAAAINKQNFANEKYAEGTALRIRSDGDVFFCHGGFTYVWVGGKNLRVGLGGSHVTAASDLEVFATSNHSSLLGTSESNSHPQTAIGGRTVSSTTDLKADQEWQDARLDALNLCSSPCVYVQEEDPVTEGEPVKLGDFWLWPAICGENIDPVYVSQATVEENRKLVCAAQVSQFTLLEARQVNNNQARVTQFGLLEVLATDIYTPLP